MPRHCFVFVATLAGLAAACQAPAGDGATGSSEGSSDPTTAGSDPPTDPSTGSTGGSSSAGSTEPADGDSTADGSDTTDTDPNAGRVPMFVAQGMIGRTVVSCDDGHTWVADRAWEAEADPLLCGNADPIRCWESGCSYLANGECTTVASECDCGHHPGFSKGIAFGNGYFVATWGWGYSGSVRRSTDGVHWEETLTDDVTFGGLAFGSNRFVASSRNPRFSEDGAGWMAGQEADFHGPDGEIAWSVRRFGYADYDTGRFVATASPPQSVLVSADGGDTWWAPSSIPDACLTDMSTYGGIAAGNGVIVGVGQLGVACRSTDGGDTWTQTFVGNDNLLGHLLWTGSEFVVWAPGMRYTSPDGQRWLETPTAPEGVWIGPAAHSEATGSFVAVSRVWDGYQAQTFLRSDDGIAWEVLPPGAFSGGHPIFEIAFGYGEPSEACPAGG